MEFLEYCSIPGLKFETWGTQDWYKNFSSET
jgi:hypothetical protein